MSARDDVDGAATERFWEDRYRSADRMWSGNANTTLVSEVAAPFDRAASPRRLSIACSSFGDCRQPLEIAPDEGRDYEHLRHLLAEVRARRSQRTVPRA